MQLSPHFTLDEFTASETAAKLSIPNTPTPRHLRRLQEVTAPGFERVRQILGRAIDLTSGYRGALLNAAVEGVATSAHCEAWAGDFPATLAEIRKLAVSGLRFDQLIHETGRGVAHISFDPRGRQQVLTQRGGPGTPATPGLDPLPKEP